MLSFPSIFQTISLLLSSLSIPLFLLLLIFSSFFQLISLFLPQRLKFYYLLPSRTPHLLFKTSVSRDFLPSGLKKVSGRGIWKKVQFSLSNHLSLSLSLSHTLYVYLLNSTCKSFCSLSNLFLYKCLPFWTFQKAVESRKTEKGLLCD